MKDSVKAQFRRRLRIRLAGAKKRKKTTKKKKTAQDLWKELTGELYWKDQAEYRKKLNEAIRLENRQYD